MLKLPSLCLTILGLFLHCNSISQSGPGGVGSTDGSSSLEGWYKGSEGLEEAASDPAEIGDLVVTWLDQSGNGNDLEMVVGDAAPYFVSNLGFDCLEFTSTFGNDRRLVAPSATGAGMTDVSIFSVFSLGSTSSNERPVAITTDPAWHTAGIGDNFAQAAENSIRKDNGMLGGAFSAVANQVRVRTSMMAPGSVEDFIDGAQNISSTSSFTTHANTLFRIGHIRRKDNTPHVYETMYFSEKVNAAQRIIIDNYLSAKYRVTMLANNVYDEDSVANGNYDYEVAGIGRVDASNIHDDAQGTSIVRMLNPTDLNNDEFLMWGHDNGSLALTSANVPASVNNRVTRVWRASEMSTSQASVDVGCLDIRFDLSSVGSYSASEVVILVDSDGDGLFSDEIVVRGASALGSDIFEFANVSCITDNARFTIGILDPTYVFPDDLVINGDNTNPCRNESIEIIVESNVFDNAIQIDWDYDDTSTETGLEDTVSHAFSTSGNFDVECIVTYPCYKDTIQLSITVANCALPLELLNYEVVCGDKGVEVNWQTASESYNDYFKVERSDDGEHYDEVAIVDGAGTTVDVTEYSWLNSKSSAGDSYYRLTQVDFDGATEMLGEQWVTCSQVEEIVVYPNPFNLDFSISGLTPEYFGGQVVVVDGMGREVFRTLISEDTKVEQVNGLSNLAKGVYQLVLESEAKVTVIPILKGT